MIKDRLNEIHNVVQRFRIEAYCFLYFVATHMINIPLESLIFDKLCLNDYRLAVDSCETIGLTESKVNNQIESTLVNLTIYQHLLSTLPSIFLTLLLGHWIDTRLDHLRYILALPCIGGAILNIFLTVQCINFNAEPIDTIYPFLFTGFSGGEILVITGAFAFICKTVEPKYRPIRFIILEAVSSLAIPLANFLSNKLLSQTPWILGQYRNYIGVFMVSGCIFTFTEFWILITLLTQPSTSSFRAQSRKVSQVSAYSYYKSLREAKARRATVFSLQVPGPSARRESSTSYGRRPSVANILMGFSLMNKQPGQRPSLGTLSEDGLENRRPSAISHANRPSLPSTDFTLTQVVHYQNIVTTFKAFFRPRVNHGRGQLVCLTISMVFIFLTLNGSTLVDETLTYKVFSWTKSHADLVVDLKIFISSIGGVLVMVLLVNLFELQDITITFIGTASMLIALLFKGSFVHPIAFYMSSTISILFGLTLAGFRSLVSQIVYNYETAKIFSIIACLMTLMHPTVIFLFAKLSITTMESKPYVLFLCLCPALLIPIVTLIYVGLTKRQTDQQRKSFCTVQVTPVPHSAPVTISTTNVFELSVTKPEERRKSNRF